MFFCGLVCLFVVFTCLCPVCLFFCKLLFFFYFIFFFIFHLSHFLVCIDLFIYKYNNFFSNFSFLFLLFLPFRLSVLLPPLLFFSSFISCNYHFPFHSLHFNCFFVVINTFILFYFNFPQCVHLFL